jgi:hypothetical protein
VVCKGQEGHGVRPWNREYLGEFSDEDPVAHGQALMSGVDEKVVTRAEGERVLGSREFASTLKME